MTDSIYGDDGPTTVNYVPSKTGVLFHNDNSLVRAVMGPVGSGKSSMAAMEVMLRSFNQVPYKGVRTSRWLAIRNTFNELKTTTIKTLQHWMPEEISHVNANYPPIARMKTQLPDGTHVDLEVLFLALDQTRDLSKMRSLEVTGVWMNEASELDKEVLEFAIQRRGRFPSKDHGGFNWSGVVMDYNPVPDDHWLYDLFEKDQLPGYRLFKQPAALLQVPNPNGVPGEMIWVGNPDAENIEHHTEGFDYYLVQIPGKSEEWIKVFIQGQYGQSTSGRAVYASEFSDKDHVAPAPLIPDKFLPVAVGFDWGLNPSAIFGQISRTGTLMITDELFPGVDTSLEEFIDTYLLPLLDDRYRGCRIEGFGDPAGVGRSPLDKRTPFMLINKVGIACRPARTNDFIPRRDAVASFLLRRKGFLLSPHCKMLREGFNRGYRYGRMQTTGLMRPRPEKNPFSHPHDALQYLALGVKTANLYTSTVTVASGGSKGTSF
jgi:hypothetical protein